MCIFSFIAFDQCLLEIHLQIETKLSIIQATMTLELNYCGYFINHTKII